ncbi:SAICAR synthetase [Violaceomyces palustris]|uniref:SAICAR synthetase n=1 Tax=Violaceomyces palustris TaxID=1673888 RepID=A0ACD0NRH5_9BASI|nr:SAICAR synthetase [Violaceomyces palustris]
MSAAAITNTDLPLKLIAKGKVRDVYDAGITEGEHAGAILFVATDRISAFDIILQNGIPNKGKLLHALSTFWFKLLSPSVIESHVIATSFSEFPESLQRALSGFEDQVQGRSMLVRRAQVVPIEAIVRGYITGSGWAEYKRSGTVHGIKLPEGLVESQEIPGGPIFTPSTKAEQGAHDENIHPDKVAELIGSKLADSVSKAAVALYSKAASHARSRGIILADTKFEFGLVPSSTDASEKQLILVDEVLTPDSSRFWSASAFKPGQGQASFDKQYVRDWLKSKGLDKAADEGVPVTLPDEVVKATEAKYREAYEMITGEKYGV